MLGRSGDKMAFWDTFAHGGARRRRVPLALTLALLGAVALSACGGGGGGGSGEPAAATLIQQAQQAINQDSAYHFTLAVDHPGAAGASGFVLTQAVGDVVRPDKITGTATVQEGQATFQVPFIGIGNQQWIQINGLWMAPGSFGIDIGTLPDPSQIISMVLSDLQHPQGIGDDSADSGDCWLVEGMVPAGDLASITGSDTTDKTPVDTQVCVAKNADGKGRYQPYEFIFAGIVAQGDTSKTTRTFMLSKFDEKVNIQPPT